MPKAMERKNKNPIHSSKFQQRHIKNKTLPSPNKTYQEKQIKAIPPPLPFEENGRFPAYPPTKTFRKFQCTIQIRRPTKNQTNPTPKKKKA